MQLFQLFLIDFARREEVETRAAIERLVEWSEPARSALGLETPIPDANGAQRTQAALAAGASIRDTYADALAETRRTYAPTQAAKAAVRRVES